MSKKFILNDETKVNQKGFRILNSGLDLERFKANPVILGEHFNSLSGVIGRWTNIQIEGHLLTAVAEFDMKSEFGKKVAEQVADGFIRGCSLGVDPLSRDNFFIEPSGDLVLTKGEVYEASIVAIPSNAKSLIKLYASSDTMTSEAEKELFANIKNKAMNKIKLTATAVYVALGYSAATELSVEEIEKGVLKLQADLDAAKAERDGYKEKFNKLNEAAKAEKLQLAASLVDEAIKAGKIDATKKAEYEELALLKPELFQDIFGKKEGKRTLTDQVETLGAESVQNLDDFLKLSFTAQMEFKENFPDEYKKITE
ncbi:HK97 family phage prohead protease [Weeksella virosa]|uniref:HK97 family phage prohead protease n=2 Tax=Weeksella virosa TaxID=1014 RepID=UPI0025556D85|nr:HK97 family phage prohead protease [Weeksella virosa]MDK7674384.1 HK97 family phage prohead protease [Weeksella virosa]